MEVGIGREDMVYGWVRWESVRLDRLGEVRVGYC